MTDRVVTDGDSSHKRRCGGSGDQPDITTFFDVGLVGNGLFPGRPRDEFGIAYVSTDLSDELKDNLDLLPLGCTDLCDTHVQASSIRWGAEL
jgi:Carbohydrate-selective porin, OprB family